MDSPDAGSGKASTIWKGQGNLTVEHVQPVLGQWFRMVITKLDSHSVVPCMPQAQETCLHHVLQSPHWVTFSTGQASAQADPGSICHPFPLPKALECLLSPVKHEDLTHNLSWRTRTVCIDAVRTWMCCICIKP